MTGTGLVSSHLLSHPSSQLDTAVVLAAAQHLNIKPETQIAHSSTLLQPGDHPGLYIVQPTDSQPPTNLGSSPTHPPQNPTSNRTSPPWQQPSHNRRPHRQHQASHSSPSPARPSGVVGQRSRRTTTHRTATPSSSQTSCAGRRSASCRVRIRARSRMAMCIRMRRGGRRRLVRGCEGGRGEGCVVFMSGGWKGLSVGSRVVWRKGI